MRAPSSSRVMGLILQALSSEAAMLDNTRNISIVKTDLPNNQMSREKERIAADHMFDHLQYHDKEPIATHLLIMYEETLGEAP